MSTAVTAALELLQPFVYAALAVAAVVQWRRQPGAASAWLASTFVVLGLVIVSAQVLPEEPTAGWAVWARKVDVGLLALFPYSLYRFMASLIAPLRWRMIAATALTAIVAVAPLLLPPFPPDDGPRPGWFQAYIAVLLVQWVLLSGLVAARLWRAGRDQPAMARRRMRTMSLGAAGLTLALVLAGEASPTSLVIDALVQLLAVASGTFMLVGFAPPSFLRMVWRGHDDAALKASRLSLMSATTAAHVVATLLPDARALVGATYARLEGPDGGVLASDGAVDDELPAGLLLRIPMSSGSLTVAAGPFTPVFGRDELAALEGLAALADLALNRNQLLESHGRLAGIVESSDDAIVSKTLDGTITSWNRGAQRLYGYTAEEVLGQSISVVVPPELEDEISALLGRIRHEESVEHYETTRRTKDGRTIDVSLTMSPIRDAEGNVTGASAIARDVTSRKRMEQEREAARDEADRANRAKSDFLSRMSHELRTPLNAVLGFAQLLDMDPLTSEQREGVSEIMKAGRHLLNLIDEVLDISRVEAGRLRLSLEPVDAAEAVRDCVSLLTPLANEEGVSLTVVADDGAASLPHVTADRQRLKQVLLNLVSNAIKYNRQHGSVRVSLRAEDERRTVCIDVADTGAGIPGERMEQLFVPFERLGAEGSGIEGTGLGLALSRSLVEAMGGRLSVSSELGTGSTFSVELVASEARAAEPTSVVPPMSATDRPASSTILYIEDNLSNLKLVEQLVARLPGAVVMSAMQGGIGVTLARDHRPDLILLDLDLPDMAGDEVLGRLRSDPRTAGIPVVVISAEATDGQIKRLLDAGARKYLSKPIDVVEFLRIVEEFCGYRP